MLTPDYSHLFGSVCEVSTGSPAVAFTHPVAGSMALQQFEQQRAAILNRLEVSNHAFEGASSDKSHGANWMLSRLSVDSDLEMDRDELDQRCRYLYRNDPIGGALDQRTNLVVGTGFTPTPKIREQAGWITDTQADQYNDELEEIYEGFAPNAGASGVDSLWELSLLAQDHDNFDGESVSILSDQLPDNNGKQIPLVIEVVDPMRLETPPGKVSDKNCRMGVQYDEHGIRVLGYWIRNKHPGETRDYDLNFTFYDKRRVIHVFKKWFGGQSRGLGCLVRTLFRLQDRKDLDQAGIVLAQIHACYVGFKTLAADEGLDKTGAARRFATDTDARGNLRKDFVPGTWTILNAGEKMEFGQPPTGEAVSNELNMTNDRRIAAALGMAYEMLANDWRGVSFAGGRIILSGVKLDTQTRQEKIATKWFKPIWERMVDEAVLLGVVSIPPRSYDRKPLYYRRHIWTPQAWAYSITPGEEINALLAAVDGNLIDKATAQAALNGGNWKHTKKLRAIERQDERDLDIVPPRNALMDQPTAPAPQQLEQQNQK